MQCLTVSKNGMLSLVMGVLGGRLPNSTGTGCSVVARADPAGCSGCSDVFVAAPLHAARAAATTSNGTMFVGSGVIGTYRDFGCSSHNRLQCTIHERHPQDAETRFSEPVRRARQEDP